ncbi:MAG: HAD hydrolase-like protein, partial [Deltaproteobacteria bacterium]|nr:HAD hydrolase-like protein [Deltaproteobacteria bacterium]
GYFDIIVSSLDVKMPKPHPESIFKILDYFNINPYKAFYIGDSKLDYQSARSAGVVFISYRNSELNADHHVNSMNEIYEIVNSGEKIE